ncbi:homeobox protein cut-like isoform X2 [Limulus polyphemus]|uniref:Homeobox protein cut-like n=1 Tax=Limulus polyphemus TaxID=6850 RepID=A0ABM1S2E2_LIMPO|nr:homeobox protein cut-like isoform X2 [Limulus polyphemus]
MHVDVEVTIRQLQKTILEHREKLEVIIQRATLAEKEVSSLKERFDDAKQSLQIQKASAMEQAVEVLNQSTLETELAAKEKKISQLADDIQSLQSTVNNLKETSASQIVHLEELLVKKNKTIEELEEKLTQQKDYAKIKKELNILKYMGFSNKRNSRNQHHSPESGPDTTSKLLLSKEETLRPDTTSKLLLNKEKAFQSQNISLKETDSDLSGEEIVSSYTNVLKKEDSSGSPSTTTSPQDMCSTDAEQHMNGSELKSLRHTFKPKSFSYDHVTLDKLQECLSQCMEKHVDDTLNTLNISRCVRELLSMHNIGQRIFAKFVLGLSQGTVSELLSKPKPWEKLTEKGRDSYRKMHAWSTDDKCIYMLKALVPKKGWLTRKLSHSKAISTSVAVKQTSKECINNTNLRSKCQDITQSKDSGVPSSKQEDPATEERIAQILTEAQNAMLNSKSREKKSPQRNGSISYSSYNGNALRFEEEGKGSEVVDNEGGSTIDRALNISNNCKESFQASNLRRSRKYDNDDIPQEMVARIYREELAKLMGQRVEEGFRLPQALYERTHEEIRHAINIYHQELSCLSQVLPLSTANLNHISTAAALANRNAYTSFTHPISLATSQSQLEVPIDATVQTQSHKNDKRSGCGSETESICRHGSAFSLVRPKTETGTSLVKPTVSHQYNTNHTSLPTMSVMSLAEMPHSGEDLSTSASPLQQMQSITNSLLSQSSLANLPNTPQRPTKAVLTPITQHQFDQYSNLNTEEIVKNVKEQLSQYSISQRLFGESVLGLSQGSVSDLLARPKPWHLLTQKGREPFIRMKIFLGDENAVHKLVASQYKIPPEKLMRTGGFGGPSNLPSASSELPHGTVEPVAAHHHALDKSYTLLNMKLPLPMTMKRSSPTTSPSISVPTNLPSSTLSTVHNKQTTSRMPHHSPPSMPYLQPSVYEMAAMTTDFDTQSITSKIKDTLLAHNIGQKIFGEVVLGLSQGSVSELLSKPKPWHMLSIKGREPFIRMQLWLNDTKNLEKLQALKNQRRGANKRRKNETYMDGNWSHYENHTYNHAFPPPSQYFSTKKQRILFSEEQKEALRLVFSMDPYPSTATIEFLSSELNLSVRTITNWFHNHRMRLKQQPLSKNDDSETNPEHLASGVKEGTKFDPVQFRMILNHRLAELTRNKGNNTFHKMYSTYQNTAGQSTFNDSFGTLDLSVSSQLFPRRSNNAYDFQFTSETVTGETDDHTNSELNEDSSYSYDRGLSESSDRESLSSYDTRQEQEDFKSSVSAPSSSSKRRKPAMPQWVDPGMEMSPDSDLCSESENNEEEPLKKGDEEIINGVCVLQTGQFDLRVSKEHTVCIEPAPAPDIKSRSKQEPVNRDLILEVTNKEGLTATENKEFQGNIKIHRKHNIERLERCLQDQGQDWDVDDEVGKKTL